MNSQQAKAILTLFRPGTADQADPEFVAALELTRRDPQLGQWFQDHCASYQALRSKFRQIPVPEGLKEQILSERKVRTGGWNPQRTLVLGLAVAGLVLFVGLTQFLLAPRIDNSFATFQNRMSRTVLRQYPKMDLLTHDLREIHQFLAQHSQGDYSLPPRLEKTTGTGCALLKWHGREVSMICFKSGKSKKDPDLFLFITDRAGLAQAPTSASPQLAQITSAMTAASWSSADKVYVLAGLGNEDFIREHL